MILISEFIVLDQSVGTMNRGAQVLGIAGHLVQAEIAVPILTNNMRLNVVLPKLAPAGVSFCARIRGCVRHLRPGIAFRRESVFQFVVYEALQERKGPGLPGVGIKAFYETLHHGSQIASRVRPVRVRRKFEGGAVKIETAIKIM